MQPFVHLHVHSQYSLLDGQASIKGLIDKAMADGMAGIALTDHGVMFGIKDFVNYAATAKKRVKGELDQLNAELEKNPNSAQLQAQIAQKEQQLKFKPVLGCECYVAQRGRHNQTEREDRSGWHLLVLAKNLTGYKNLIKMVSKSWTEGFYYRPRIDRELLEEHKEGLIISSACLGGEVPRKIAAGDMEGAEETIQWYKKTFGDDYYLELQRHKATRPDADHTTFPKQEEVNKVLLELGKKHDVKVIASNDVHFVNEEDADAHDRLICLSTGRDFDDPNRMRYSKQEWLKTTAEMNQVFGDHPETLSNTLEILDKVEEYSIDNPALMPFFPIDESFGTEEGYKEKYSETDLIEKFGPAAYERMGGYDKVIRIMLEGDYLRHLTYEGAHWRYGEELTQEITDRLDFELDTIINMGFPGYFLIVYDFIKAAREMGVAVGPGRGSAAGSAVAYCLHITDIDPLKYDLLFERFLNPDRISMPDIDIDFDDEGRDKVLQWVTEKYGYEKVARIITYGTMATKSSIRDVARVHKLPLAEADRLAKLIPDRIPDKKVNLRESIKYVPELSQAAQSPDPLLSDTLKYAQVLEGNVRSTGVHACGVIIGQTDISDIVPISTAVDSSTKEKVLVTQFEGKVIEQTGLIKMDFLGLKTLTIIKDAVENIEINRGKKIDINAIPLDDRKTYELYSNGQTTGTFQFESAGMQKYLRELKPSQFEDLIAMNALYRPGPMDYIPSFIKRKHGEEEIAYDIPIMEEYLQETYGITVYQEQVMLLARLLADFTRGESDELRSAMGKKLADKMVPLKAKFMKGGTNNGYETKVLEKIWADWERFAQYAFNKSHSTCYSWLAYQTAWLKANYPSEYMASVLSNNLNNIGEITKFMDECKAMGINVLSPDVNESLSKFSVNNEGHVRFGMGAIKGVGGGAVKSIVDERDANGPYKDVFDFVERVNLSSCNKRTIESLALSGAFDSLEGVKREHFIAKNEKGEEFLDVLIRYGNRFQQDQHQAMNSLFGDDSSFMIARPELPQVNPFSDLERLNKERELIGIYLSAHPLDEYEFVLKHVCNADSLKLQNLEPLNGNLVTFGGLVTAVREGQTKRGSPFTIMTVEDYSGSIDLAFFGEDSVNFGRYARIGLSLYINARIQPKPYRQEEMEIKVTNISLLTDVKDTLVTKITLQIYMEDITATMISDLTALIKNNSGNSLLYFNIVSEELGYGVELFSRPTKVSVTKKMVDYLVNDLNIDFKIN